MGDFARAGFLNLVGGCCGTTQDHIAAIAAAVDGVAPRRVPTPPVRTRLSGLEPSRSGRIALRERGRAHERDGIAALRQPHLDDDYEAALEVALQQVRNGAQIIDVNMDEGMLDSEAAMVRFLNLLAASPRSRASRS